MSARRRGRPRADGAATLTTFFADPGEFVVTAEYTADDGFIDSAADPVDVTVTGDPDSVPPPAAGRAAWTSVR